ncbi:MAG: four helix bundle protein [Candidatus Marinimicrobia bacterium]|nr:four helix bundle protein [Candidatus Neomarinimicrobiota bacterium]
MVLVNSHRDFRVSQISISVSMELYEITKRFPREKIFSLTDQIRRSSRSLSSNIAEAFRKRKYLKSFISKLSDSEAEAAETRNWLDYAFKCNFITEHEHQKFDKQYNDFIGMIVNMRLSVNRWQAG